MSRILSVLMKGAEGGYSPFREMSDHLWDLWDFGEIPPEVMQMQTFLGAAGIRPELFPSASDYRFAVLLGHGQATWASYGFPTFELGADTSASMLLTDPSSVPWEDVVFPFPTFSVLLPYPASPLWYTNAVDVPIPAQHVLFHQCRTMPPWVDQEKVYKLGGWPALKELHVDSYFMMLMGPSDSTNLWHTYTAPSAGDKTDSFLGVLGADWFDPAAEGMPGELDVHALKAAGRLVVNLAIYIADLQSKGEWSPFGVKRKAKKGKSTYPVRRWVLNSIKLAPALRRAADTRMLGSPQWKVEARHLVRGHWKSQPCGKGRLERKRVAVQPYWRGPEDGPVLPKPIMEVGVGDGVSRDSLLSKQ